MLCKIQSRVATAAIDATQVITRKRSVRRRVRFIASLQSRRLSLEIMPCASFKLLYGFQCFQTFLDNFFWKRNVTQLFGELLSLCKPEGDELLHGFPDRSVVIFFVEQDPGERCDRICPLDIRIRGPRTQQIRGELSRRQCSRT